MFSDVFTVAEHLSIRPRAANLNDRKNRMEQCPVLERKIVIGRNS